MNVFTLKNMLLWFHNNGLCGTIAAIMNGSLLAIDLQPFLILGETVYT